MNRTKNSRSSLNKTATAIAAAVTTLGFVLSLALSLTILHQQGNPALLIFWAIALAAATRLGRKWLGTIGSLRTPPTAAPVQHAQNKWPDDVIDVAFKDMPNEQASFSHCA